MVKAKPQLIDKFGRAATNLRISVTDRCNLRCAYCVLNEKINWLNNEQLLTFNEIIRVVEIATGLGVNQLRITGGEPLFRPGVCELISDLVSLPGIKKVSMTTNGVLLNQFLDDLEKSGLSSINVSLDTLNPDKFSQITKRKDFDLVYNNIIKTINSKIKVKVNTVALKGFNDSELLDFAEFAIKNEITVRFIEFMPFKGNNWISESLLSAKEMYDIISKQYNLKQEPLEHSSQTSRVYQLDGTSGKIGFIASVTNSFCQWCNRLRLTADGNLRTCLNGKDETALRPLLRSSITNAELQDILIKTVQKKPKEHVDFLNPEYKPPTDDREMIRIGG